MDFIRYAEASAALLNAELADRDDLVATLTARDWLHDQATDRDATVRWDASWVTRSGPSSARTLRRPR